MPPAQPAFSMALGRFARRRRRTFVAAMVTLAGGRLTALSGSRGALPAPVATTGVVPAPPQSEPAEARPNRRGGVFGWLFRRGGGERTRD
jgi:hypothetical protein